MTPEQLLGAVLSQVDGMTPEEAAAALRSAAERLRAWRASEPVRVFGFALPVAAQEVAARCLAAEADHRASMIEASSGLTSAPLD